MTNNTVYNRDDSNYQDQQERQVSALREFYTERSDMQMAHVHVVDSIDEPLEKTQMYGPFPLDVVRWAQMMPERFVRLFVDADGREVVEY